jgi:hypothetical protein
MQFGAATFGGSPFGANQATGDFFISVTLNLSIPVNFVFFGEIGDVIILPPDLVIESGNMNYRRSPCILYEN